MNGLRTTLRVAFDTGRSAPSNVVTGSFPSPFRLTVRRQCRTCRDWVSIDLCNGAEAPREGWYRCSACHATPEATEGRVLALVAPQQPLTERPTEVGHPQTVSRSTSAITDWRHRSADVRPQQPLGDEAA